MKKIEYNIRAKFTLESSRILTFDEVKSRFELLGNLVGSEQKGCYLTCYFK
jgi:hypothetical protein